MRSCRPRRKRPDVDGDHGMPEGQAGRAETQQPTDDAVAQLLAELAAQSPRKKSPPKKQADPDRRVGSARPAELGYVKKATQYAHDVVSGSIPACGWVIKACQRYLGDLANDSVLWPYRFDTRSAERPCAFMELLSHVKGTQGGRRFQLEPWQCFIVINIFGCLQRVRSFIHPHVAQGLQADAHREGVRGTVERQPVRSAALPRPQFRTAFAHRGRSSLHHRVGLHAAYWID